MNLKPCPLCGDKIEYLEYSNIFTGCWYFEIECGKCGVGMYKSLRPKVDGRLKDSTQKKEVNKQVYNYTRKLERAWNKRAKE